MNESTEQPKQPFSPEELARARELSDIKEAQAVEIQSAREAVERLHRPEKRTVQENVADMSKHMEAAGSDVHFEVAPDFPLPNAPVASDKDKIELANKLIESGDEPYNMVEFIKNLKK